MSYEPLASDFYSYGSQLTEREQEALGALREWLEREVRPIVNDHWERAEFPMQVVKPLADLAELVAANPAAVLGPELAREGARLPFLLKLLAAERPLSLQAHPTPEQARAGFAREEAEGVPLDAFDRDYRDPYAKPELVVAVSDAFEALSGFRPLDEVHGVLRVLRAADAASDEPQAGAIELLASRLEGADPLRESVEWLLQDGRGGDTGEAAWVVERVTALASSDIALTSPYAAT